MRSSSSRFLPLGHDFFLALHGAEEKTLEGHEALAHQTLGTTGALEALWLSVPVELAVGNPLGLGVHCLLAGRAILQRRRIYLFTVKTITFFFKNLLILLYH